MRWRERTLEKNRVEGSTGRCGIELEGSPGGQLTQEIALCPEQTLGVDPAPLPPTVTPYTPYSAHMHTVTVTHIYAGVTQMRINVHR